jgi:hypothetical protein
MTESPSDQQLVTAVAEGDRSALAALYHRHAPWLLVRLSRRCPDQDIVEEAIQDTLIAVWQNARSYSGRGEQATLSRSLAKESTSPRPLKRPSPGSQKKPSTPQKPASRAIEPGKPSLEPGTSANLATFQALGAGDAEVTMA